MVADTWGTWEERDRAVRNAELKRRRAAFEARRRGQSQGQGQGRRPHPAPPPPPAAISLERGTAGGGNPWDVRYYRPGDVEGGDVVEGGRDFDVWRELDQNLCEADLAKRRVVFEKRERRKRVTMGPAVAAEDDGRVFRMVPREDERDGQGVGGGYVDISSVVRELEGRDRIPSIPRARPPPPKPVVPTLSHTHITAKWRAMAWDTPGNKSRRSAKRRSGCGRK